VPSVAQTDPVPRREERPRLVFFYSPLSGRCRRVEGFIAQVLQRRRNHETFDLVRVSVERRPDFAEKFRVEQVPTICVLEARKLTRVGGTAEVDVDVRLICATNRDLEAEVKRGRFRQDLYFRVSAFTLLVPPLRDRRAEIVPLAEHFARQFAAELKQPVPAFTVEAKRLLECYAWPGNVRELKNVVERAVVLHPGVLAPEHLPESLAERAPPETRMVREQIADVERAAIVAAMEASGWNQTHAAQRLGLSRRALIYKLEKHGLKAPPPSAR